MADQTDSHSDRTNTISDKTIVSLSLSSVYWVASAIVGIIWMGIRLWIGGIEDDLRAIRGAISAEEAARLQNGARISRLESQYERHAEQHLNYDRAFDAVWKKFDRLEDERWNRKR